MDKIKIVRAVTAILTAAATPFGAWAMGETSLRAAVVLGVIAGLGSLHNWLTESPTYVPPALPPGPTT